jgi:hypothetical protein
MIKYFTYNISNFKGYRLKVEESNLKCFKKIIYNGFKIIESSLDFINYEIDFKLIRCLKLKKINDIIRPISVEDRILKLLESSKEVDKSFIYPSYSGYGGYGTFSNITTYYYDNGDDDEIVYNKSQNKERNRYQSKIYAQKAKIYENTSRFCK